MAFRYRSWKPNLATFADGYLRELRLQRSECSGPESAERRFILSKQIFYVQRTIQEERAELRLLEAAEEGRIPKVLKKSTARLPDSLEGEKNMYAWSRKITEGYRPLFASPAPDYNHLNTNGVLLKWRIFMTLPQEKFPAN